MKHSDMVPRYLTGKGVEIGAFTRPIPGISPVYVDRYPHYAGESTGADYYGDACDLPFHDSSLQYVATSHVLEHAANPLAALAEWFRVLRHGGYIYSVIPDRKKTFDHTRPLTEVAHMLEDYRNRVTMCDPTHIDEFVYGMDWKLFSPDSDPVEEMAERAALAADYRGKIAAGGEINIHFHTFESFSALELIESGNRERLWPGRIEAMVVVEDYPEPDQMGFLIVARVVKKWSLRYRSLFSRKGLRKNAKKFPAHT